MDADTERQPNPTLSAFFAGLQAGMLGVLWMLAWMGLSAAWQQRSFWTAENLMASAFYGASAVHSGFASETLSGLALYVALYSLLGALLALILRDRLPRLRAVLVSVVFAIAWYYLSFHVLWRSLIPLLALLHVEHSTILGHLIYGTVLGRYPAYLGRPATPAAEPTPEPTTPENPPAE